MSKKNIQVVYIITKLELGGAQKVCLSLFKGLSQAGCATKLISSTQGPLVQQVERSPNVILLDSMMAQISLRGVFREFYTFLQLMNRLRRLKKQHPQIMVHTHSTKAGILGRWAAWFAGIKTRVHTVHGYAFHDHQSRLAWWTIYLCELVTSLITTHFVCVSAQDVKTGSALFPRFAKKHSIIRAAVDGESFYQPAGAVSLPSGKQPFIFGSVSCFKPQKNLFDLLRAFEQVHMREPRARLEIIGDGVLRPQIEQWIRERAFGRVITLHGWKQPVAPIMKTWHAFMLSSLWEGLPCAVVEARLLRLPVISYHTGGIGEVITDQENGLLYKQGDWQGLAHGMMRMMGEAAFYRTCQQYQDFLTDFEVPHMVQEHILLYQQLLGGSGHNHKIV